MFETFPDVINTEELCKMLHISKNTAYILIRSGELPAKRIGRPYDPDYISKLFCKATIAYGRPDITLHKLRHTCASLLINKGWDVKKLQYWLGHSDTSTTLNIYSHFNKERLNEMPDDLEQLSESCADLFGA